MELKFETDRVEVEHGRFSCEVVADVKESDILDQFTAEEICNYFDHSLLLEAIGEANARDHFGIGDD